MWGIELPLRRMDCLYDRLFWYTDIVIDPEYLELSLWLSFQLSNRHYGGVMTQSLSQTSCCLSQEPRWAWESRWACFCWLQKSWVCWLTLKTVPSCPALIPTLYSTMSLIAGSAEHSPPHQLKISHGRFLHFKERTFFNSVMMSNNRKMDCYNIL